MFDRIIRVFKSWIGYFISFAEDPEVMLQESIEEMRNTLPRLNQVLVTTRATVIRLEQELVELERKEKSLIGSIQAALKEGSPEARKLAESDAMQLQSLRQELTATREQLEAAKNGFENAKVSVEDIKAKLEVLLATARGAATSRRPTPPRGLARGRGHGPSRPGSNRTSATSSAAIRGVTPPISPSR